MFSSGKSSSSSSQNLPRPSTSSFNPFRRNTTKSATKAPTVSSAGSSVKSLSSKASTTNIRPPSPKSMFVSPEAGWGFGAPKPPKPLVKLEKKPKKEKEKKTKDKNEGGKAQGGQQGEASSSSSVVSPTASVFSTSETSIRSQLSRKASAASILSTSPMSSYHSRDESGDAPVFAPELMMRKDPEVEVHGDWRDHRRDTIIAPRQRDTIIAPRNFSIITDLASSSTSTSPAETTVTTPASSIHPDPEVPTVHKFGPRPPPVSRKDTRRRPLPAIPKSLSVLPLSPPAGRSWDDSNHATEETKERSKRASRRASVSVNATAFSSLNLSPLTRPGSGQSLGPIFKTPSSDSLDFDDRVPHPPPKSPAMTRANSLLAHRTAKLAHAHTSSHSHLLDPPPFQDGAPGGAFPRLSRQQMQLQHILANNRPVAEGGLAWSGEWNRGSMNDVITQLRSLK